MCCRPASTVSATEPVPGLDPGGLFANGGRVRNIARARELLGADAPEIEPAKDEDDDAAVFPQPCPCCGGRMVIIETFERGAQPRAPPTATSRVDAS